MDPLTAAKLWLMVKPIKRIRIALNKRRARKGKELLSIGEDDDMLRTSSGAGLVGIGVNILLQIMQAFPVTAELAANPEVAAGLTAVLMYVTARFWKTPSNPGKI